MKVEEWFPEAGECGKSGDIDQRLQAFSYKMNKFWRPNMYGGEYNVNLIVVIYVYQIIMLDTLNLHIVICQLYPNKAGKINSSSSLSSS